MRERQQLFRHAGYEMRSHSETRWAGMMDALDIAWLYEPETVETRHDFYLPDFFLPAIGAFVEVKGLSPTMAEIEKAKDAEAVTGRPVLFAHGKTEMQGASLAGGAVTYFRGDKKASFTTYEISEVVRHHYDIHAYAAFISAGDHQPKPDAFSAHDLVSEFFTRMLDRQGLEQYLADQHRPLNQAKKCATREASPAEKALMPLVARLRSREQGVSYE